MSKNSSGIIQPEMASYPLGSGSAREAAMNIGKNNNTQLNDLNNIASLSSSSDSSSYNTPTTHSSTHNTPVNGIEVPVVPGIHSISDPNANTPFGTSAQIAANTAIGSQLHANSAYDSVSLHKGGGINKNNRRNLKLKRMGIFGNIPRTTKKRHPHLRHRRTRRTKQYPRLKRRHNYSRKYTHNRRKNSKRIHPYFKRNTRKHKMKHIHNT